MKRIIVFLIVVISLVIILGFSFKKAKASPLQPLTPSVEIEQNILAATFQLQVFNQEGTYYEQGFATLVSQEGQKLLVTHNHWHFLSSFSKVTILDAESQLVATLDKIAFKSLVLYSSRGTLVLQAPDGLNSRPAELGEITSLHSDEQILIVHQRPTDTSKTEVIPGVIQNSENFHQNPTLRLGIPKNETIIKGDSGGGIWVDGKLVANMWSYQYEIEYGLSYLEIRQVPIAAIVPMEAIEMVTKDRDNYTEVNEAHERSTRNKIP